MCSPPATLILPSGVGVIEAYKNKIPHEIHATNLCFALTSLNKPLVHIIVLSVLLVMATMKKLNTLVHSGSFTSDKKIN